jgi:peptide/nickel transport system permease protein
VAQQITAVDTPAQTGSSESGRLRSFWTAMRRSPSGFIGLILVAVIVLGSIIGPYFTSPLVADPSAIFEPFGSPGHLLGTDNEGKDILIQMVQGGRDIILIGFFAAAMSTAIALLLGSLSAYIGGAFDAVVVTITDMVLTIPSIVLLAVIGAMVKLDTPLLLGGLVGILGWPVLTRTVRSQVLSLKEREFVEASRLLDMGTARVVFVEILPNMASFILMNFMISVRFAVYGVVGLYLLGLAPITASNWGIMLNRAQISGAYFNSGALPLVLCPVIALTALLFGLVLLTRSLEEILNPRLRDR